jgi:4-amino-4-deoxy-L-arabinose transferase-like glycosyltransferase
MWFIILQEHGYNSSKIFTCLYKLPSFLFWLLGILLLFKLSKTVFNKKVAQLSVLIYTVILHGVISNFDVRAEIFLSALIIGSIYYIYQLSRNHKWYYYLYATLCIGCAIMTKGIFVLSTIGFGFVVYWLDYQNMENPFQLEMACFIRADFYRHTA